MAANRAARLLKEIRRIMTGRPRPPRARASAKAERPTRRQPSLAGKTTSVTRLHDLVTAYYEETFERFPIGGSAAGRHEFDGELGRATPAMWERQMRLTRRSLAAIENLPVQDFEAADMLDRRAMLANLRLIRLEFEELGRWRNDPQLHLQAAADAIHELVVKHGENLAPVARSLVSRLRRMPRFLDEAAECIERPDPLWQRLTLKAAPAVAEMIQSLVEPLDRALTPPEPKLCLIAQAAAEAVARYADRVGRREPAAEGSYAIGEARLAALMRERLGTPWSPGEAAAMARRMTEELGEALRREARRFHPKRSPAEILERAARAWTPEGESLLDAYRRATDDVRERFRESGWVGFPQGDRLLVRPVPAFMRDRFPTAAYSAPGALDPDQTGIFWVNDLTECAPDERRRRAELAQHFGLELTCAHEAYPGHHLQYVHQNRIPSLARKMAHHAIYYEGWTLWCEQMAAELLGADRDNPYLKLAQLHDALWRAWRIVIDVGLHTGELSYTAACGVLMREVGFTRARAQGDVNWYTAAPTVPMSYLLGKMELLRLKRRRVDLGDWTLREFNDWVLSFGAIPWRWIEESGL
jgi:uncharacterized protein (DUF885 family)